MFPRVLHLRITGLITSNLFVFKHDYHLKEHQELPQLLNKDSITKFDF